jgi:hypothetical protein
MTFQIKSAIVLFISTCLFVTSCRKDDRDSVDQKNFPRKLYLTDFTFKDNVKIYTKNGEITDSVIKSRALISTGIDLISHPFNPLSAQESFVSFLSKDRFVMSNDEFSIETLSNTFVFRYVDSSAIPPHDLFVLNSAFYAYPLVTKNKNDNYFTYRRKFVGHGDYSALKISGMDLCILKRDTITGTITNRYVGFVLNEFNVDGIKTLGRYDTIAVREYNYHYKG